MAIGNVLQGAGSGLTTGGLASGNPLLAIGGVALGGLGSYLTGSDQASAEREAYRQRMAALQQANQFGQQGYDASQAALSPLMQAYSGSSQNYANMVNNGSFDQQYGKTAQDFGYTDDVSKFLDPQAAYQRQQMGAALAESAAANGMMRSGGFQKELQDRANQLGQSGWGQAVGSMQNANQGALSQYSTGLQEFMTRMANRQSNFQNLANAEGSLLGNQANAINSMYQDRANNALAAGNAGVQRTMGVNNAWNSAGANFGDLLGQGASGALQSGVFNGWGQQGQQAQQNPQQQSAYASQQMQGYTPAGQQYSPQVTGSGLFDNAQSFGQLPTPQYPIWGQE